MNSRTVYIKEMGVLLRNFIIIIVVFVSLIALIGCAASTPRTPDEEYEWADRVILYQEKYLRYVQGCNVVRGNVRIIRSGRALPQRCLYTACPARIGDTYLCVGR